MSSKTGAQLDMLDQPASELNPARRRSATIRRVRSRPALSLGTEKTPGNGRVYHIYFTGSDGRGGSCTGEVKVGVPHDQSAASQPPVDDGPLYNSVIGTRK